jgi:hypothetical protein
METWDKEKSIKYINNMEYDVQMEKEITGDKFEDAGELKTKIMNFWYKIHNNSEISNEF